MKDFFINIIACEIPCEKTGHSKYSPNLDKVRLLLLFIGLISKSNEFSQTRLHKPTSKYMTGLLKCQTLSRNFKDKGKDNENFDVFKDRGIKPVMFHSR